MSGRIIILKEGINSEYQLLTCPHCTAEYYLLESDYLAASAGVQCPDCKEFFARPSHNTCYHFAGKLSILTKKAGQYVEYNTFTCDNCETYFGIRYDACFNMNELKCPSCNKILSVEKAHLKSIPFGKISSYRQIA